MSSGLSIYLYTKASIGEGEQEYARSDPAVESGEP